MALWDLASRGPSRAWPASTSAGGASTWSGPRRADVRQHQRRPVGDRVGRHLPAPARGLRRRPRAAGAGRLQLGRQDACSAPGRTAASTCGTSPDPAVADPARPGRPVRRRQPRPGQRDRPSSTSRATGPWWPRGRHAYMVDLGDRQARRRRRSTSASPLHQWPELSLDGERMAIGPGQRPWPGMGRRDPPAAARRAGGRPVRGPDLVLRATPASPATGAPRPSPPSTTRRPTGPRSPSTTSTAGCRSGRRLADRGCGAATGSAPARTAATWSPRPRPASPRCGSLREHREVARLQLPEEGSATVARFSRGRPVPGRRQRRRPARTVASGGLEVPVAGRGRPQRVRRRAELLARRQRCWPARAPTRRSSCTTWRTGGLLGGAFGPDRNSWLYAEYRADRNEVVGYFDDGSMVALGRRPGVPGPDRLQDRRPGHDPARVGPAAARPPVPIRLPRLSPASPASLGPPPEGALTELSPSDAV